MQGRILGCGEGNVLVEGRDNATADGPRAIGGQPDERVFCTESDLPLENRRSHGRRHSLSEVAELRGEHVPQARDKELKKAGAHDSSFAEVEEVASGETLEAVVHLARAHVEGLRNLRLGPRGPRRRDELQRDDNVLRFQAQIQGSERL